MNKYEAIYIIDSAMEDSVRIELIARFNELITSNGGELEKVDEWGKRRLAYTIDYKNEGYYVLLHFSAGPELPREFERNLQNNENILRYLIVKLEEKRSNVKPRAVPSRPVYPGPDVEHAAQAPVVAATAPVVVAEPAAAQAAEVVAEPIAAETAEAVAEPIAVETAEAVAEAVAAEVPQTAPIEETTEQA